MNSTVVHKRKVSVPVILDFVPTSCSIRLNQSANNSVPPSIDMGLRVSARQSLSTSDGRPLENGRWGITIYRGATGNERIRALDAVGLVNYVPATKGYDYSIEEGCSAWAHLDVASFDLLQTFVMSGRVPSSLRIHAEGKRLRYGYATDGSEAIWDITTEVEGSPDTEDWVAVNQLELSLDIAGQDEDEEPTPDALRPVSADDLNKLEQVLSTSLSGYLSTIKLWLGWLLAVAAAIAVIVFFASWYK